MKPYRGPSATLGSTAAARVRLTVWCKDCRHQVEPDPAEMAVPYGAGTTGTHWPLTNPLEGHGLKRTISALWIAGIRLWKALYDAFVTPFTLVSAAFGACAGGALPGPAHLRGRSYPQQRERDPPCRGKSGIVTYMMAPFHLKAKVNPHFYIRLYLRQIVESVIIAPARRFWRGGR
jgi:hypothetical protein